MPRDASPEQIRETFRGLVRLLHPDQQTERQLKEIAELQMRKLNRIYSVLSDPERRRRYDDFLEDDERAPAIVFRPSRDLSLGSRQIARLCWAGAAIGISGVLIWLASESTGVAPVQSLERPAGNESANEIARLRAELRTATSQREAAIRESGRLRNVRSSHAERSLAGVPTAAEFHSTSAPLTSALTPSEPLLPSADVFAAAVSPAIPQEQQTKQFAGFWFYNRPPQGQHNRDRALYLPEFIEANITEQSGTIHGRYRSRYRIPDRAVSPDVNFEFIGSATGATLKCPFTGPGGVKGEVTVQLTGENAMSIEWIASELGSAQGLASGTAKLIRRQD